MTQSSTASSLSITEKPCRVMVVDDSSVIRSVICKILSDDPHIDVVTTASNGQSALDAMKYHDLDVVVLDIEMPVMDGLEALPKILERDPSLKVVMASTLTLRNAEISFQAMALGASDYIPKPTSSKEAMDSQIFQRDLLEKVKSLTQARRRARGVSTPSPTRVSSPTPQPSLYAGGSIKLRPMPMKAPSVIAIGSSTGGPQALLSLLKDIQGKFKQPIVITQHMPPRFTTVLAEHLAKASGCDVFEATEGQELKGGCIYVAPGNFHMCAVQEGTVVRLTLNQEAPENFCRPAVDPMFRSLASIYKGRVLAVVLTGMGSDGLKGSEVLVNGGSFLIAQDENTSVVWGMPGAVATAGLCSAVLPLNQIQDAMCRIAQLP